MDSIGYLHNEMLSYFYDKLATNDTNHRQNEIYLFNETLYMRRAAYDSIIDYAKQFLLNQGLSAQ